MHIHVYVFAGMNAEWLASSYGITKFRNGMVSGKS
jgi:hypothetical protein